jgi:hypothetical protein
MSFPLQVGISRVSRFICMYDIFTDFLSVHGNGRSGLPPC